MIMTGADVLCPGGAFSGRSAGAISAHPDSAAFANSGKGSLLRGLDPQRIFHFYLDVQPPSINSVCPVIRAAAGEARNTTAPATSMGSPIRCKAAIRSTTSARNAGSASAALGSGSADESGGYRIHQDIMLAPFDGQALSKV